MIRVVRTWGVWEPVVQPACIPWTSFVREVNQTVYPWLHPEKRFNMAQETRQKQP